MPLAREDNVAASTKVVGLERAGQGSDRSRHGRPEGARHSAGAHNVTAIDKVLQALHNVTAESGLSLDPDADSYALVSANILQLPTGLDALAQARRHFDAGGRRRQRRRACA